MTPTSNLQIARLARFGLTTPDASRLSRFYEQALGFGVGAAERRSGADFQRLMGVQGDAMSTSLGVGDEIVELLQFDRPGRPYPTVASSSDLCFQHFAIVVLDMSSAYQRLSSVTGWTAISTDGPEKLPASSGGVVAFKFRDPDGHPLELLAFPEDKYPPHWKARFKSGGCLGIDHSAISVSDSAHSIAFYLALGFHVAARSVNVGPEQERLDAVENAHVEVTALEPAQTTPHLELLSYRSAARGEKIVLGNNDVAATRLVFEVVETSKDIATSQALIDQALVDPDGHHLMIVPSSDNSPTLSRTNAGLPPASINPESIS